MAKKSKPRLRSYVVWLSNHTDRRDDEPRMVKARTTTEARDMVADDPDVGLKAGARFSIGNVYTLPDFYKCYPEWKGLL